MATHTMKSVCISGTGLFTPPHSISNDELVACYTDRGAVHAAEQRLNSHGQFLQGGAALGWPGLLLTLAVGLIPLVIALRERRAMLAVFAALFILNAAVESVLEVQAGVVLLGAFLGLLAAQRSSHP